MTDYPILVDGSGIAFDPALWAAVLRVARPGAWMAVFGGTRTHLVSSGPPLPPSIRGDP